MTPDRSDRARKLLQAFDEVEFGAARTLNLRNDLPTAAQAVERAEQWLRERQASASGEVLVITGAGRGSVDGVPVVREAVLKLLTRLKRRGVIAAVREHSAGSFVIRLAPLSALFDGGRRKRDEMQPEWEDPRVLQALDRETRRLLRRLSERSLERLGARELGGRFLSDEMVRQFGVLGASVPEGPEREQRLRQVIRQAIQEIEEGE